MTWTPGRPRLGRLPPLIPGRTDDRILIGAGQVVAFHAVEAQLSRDGSVELVGIEIETHGPALHDGSDFTTDEF